MTNSHGQVSLGAREVHLWALPLIEDEGAEQRARYESWMTEEERARAERFLFERDQRQHRLTRALCRWTLSRYSDSDARVHPSAWRFGRGERGKPFVSEPSHTLPLYFNITHTAGLIALTVSRELSYHGVDAETVSRRARFDSLARRHFAPSEIAALQDEVEANIPERFFAYWTLKESYIKAEGLGLAIPLDQFAFELDRGPEIGFWLAPERRDDANAWWFTRCRVGVDHRVAVGIRAGCDVSISLRARTLLESELTE